MRQGPNREHKFKSWLAWTFAGITIATAITALLVYPRVAYPNRPSAVVATAETQREVSWMQVQVAEETPGDGHLGIFVDLYAVGDLDDVPETNAEIVILVPTVVNDSLECVDDQPCELSIYTSPYFNPYRQNRAYVQAEWKELDEPSDYGSLRASVRLNASNFVPMQCSEYACRGSVPRLFVTMGTKLASDAAAGSILALENLIGYQWESEYLSSGQASPYLQFTTPLDEATELKYLSRPGVDGENESALNEASDRLFISGALVGVAGGALLATFTEASEWMRLRPTVRRRAKK